MNTIILVRGIQGSGKSTWAKQWVNEDPNNRVRFNNDDIRIMLSNNENYVSLIISKNREKLVKNIKESFVLNAMEMNYDIVLDNMNLNPKETIWIKAIIDNYNNTHDNKYTYEYKDFFISLEECIERDKNRQYPIGAKIIKDTYRRYRQIIIGDSVKKLVENQCKYNNNLPNCIIADMDATICYNISGRPFFGKGAAEEMINDIPNNGIIKIIHNYINTMNKNDKIFIITGREATIDIKNATIEYVNKYIGKTNTSDSNIIILMRNEKDFRSGEIVKQELYETYIKDKYNVDFVLDDSKKIVKMYRNLGLTVLQPNDGLF